jgi:MFS family permease
MEWPMVNRNIQLCILYSVFINFVFILPIIVPYLTTIGISFQEFLIGEAVFAAVVILCEVPSGWISDIWSRRRTMMLGQFVAIIGFSVLAFADNFYEMIISQGILGVAIALNSGTVSALLYDTLLMEQRQDEFNKHQGRSHGLGLYAVACACALGALMYQLDPKLPLIAQIWGATIGMILSFFMTEPPRTKAAPEKTMFKDIMETIRYALHGHKEVTGIILVSTIVFCTTKLFLWAQQPFYMEAGVPTAWFGVIMGAIYILSGSAGILSHRIQNFGTDRIKIMVMSATLVISALLLWAVDFIYLSIALFMIGTMVFGVGFPIVQNAINHLVGSERRATILSTASLMVQLIFIPMSFILGAIQDASGTRTAMLCLGIIVAVLSAIGFWIWKPRKVTQPNPA